MSLDQRREAEVRVAAQLAAAQLPNADVDARWLVDHVIEVTGDPTGCGGALLDGLVARRVAREPLQLVIGRTWFRTLELTCSPGVFIPRPETEIVAGLAIDAARDAVTATVPADAAPEAGAVRIVEACTGTGAIALSIAAEVAGVDVIAGDVSHAAVDLAKENLARVRGGSAGGTLAEGSTVAVVRSELLDGVDPTWYGRVDVLVANPPYLPESDRGTWEPEVSDHDPYGALVGGADGHEIVDALLALAAGWLAPGGIVVLEIDQRRGADAIAAAVACGLDEVRIERDLTGADRAVVARRPADGASRRGRHRHARNRAPVERTV